MEYIHQKECSAAGSLCSVLGAGSHKHLGVFPIMCLLILFYSLTPYIIPSSSISLLCRERGQAQDNA